MNLLLIIGLVFISEPSFATDCGVLDQPIQRAQVPCLVDELIRSHFPELVIAKAEGRIRYRDMSSDRYFLKTTLGLHFYSIDLNPKLFSAPPANLPAPSVEAIQGILAHELVHLVDYEVKSIGGLAKIGWKELFRPAEYERSTDEQAFVRGFAKGIRSYREWIYTRLAPNDLVEKKRRYYTPNEIDHWLTTH